MRPIMVSTDVFSRIWAQRRAGEETENDILERLVPKRDDADEGEDPRAIGGGGGNSSSETPGNGHVDRRYGVHFPEGFEIYRTYLGKDFSAQSVAKGWKLATDGNVYGSLNELSKAIGAKVENAWLNWFFRAPDGSRKCVSELRDSRRIVRRTRRPINADDLLAELGQIPEREQ